MNSNPLVDVPFASAYLNVSTSTVRRLAKSGELPARRVGRQLRFEHAVLLDYTGAVETLAAPLGGFDFAAAHAAMRYPG